MSDRDGQAIARWLTRDSRDRADLHEFVTLLETMTAAEIERFYRGLFNTLTAADVIFQRRFPDVYARIAREIDDGYEPMKL